MYNMYVCIYAFVYNKQYIKYFYNGYKQILAG